MDAPDPTLSTPDADRLTIRLPDRDRRAALDAYARRTGLSRSDVARMALYEYLDRQARPGGRA